MVSPGRDDSSLIRLIPPDPCLLATDKDDRVHVHEGEVVFELAKRRDQPLFPLPVGIPDDSDGCRVGKVPAGDRDRCIQVVRPPPGTRVVEDDRHPHLKRKIESSFDLLSRRQEIREAHRDVVSRERRTEERRCRYRRRDTGDDLDCDFCAGPLRHLEHDARHPVDTGIAAAHHRDDPLPGKGERA